jgi:hypothetical protein
MALGRLLRLKGEHWLLVDADEDASSFPSYEAAEVALEALPSGPAAREDVQVITAELARHITYKRREPQIDTTPGRYITCLLCEPGTPFVTDDCRAAIAHVEEAHTHPVYGQNGGWRAGGHADGDTFTVDMRYLYVNGRPVLRDATVTARARSDLFRTLGAAVKASGGAASKPRRRRG